MVTGGRMGGSFFKHQVLDKATKVIGIPAWIPGAASLAYNYFNNQKVSTNVTNKSKSNSFGIGLNLNAKIGGKTENVYNNTTYVTTNTLRNYLGNYAFNYAANRVINRGNISNDININYDGGGSYRTVFPTNAYVPDNVNNNVIGTSRYFNTLASSQKNTYVNNSMSTSIRRKRRKRKRKTNK